MIPFIDYMVDSGADINANYNGVNSTCLHAIIEGSYEHCYDVAPYYRDYPRLKKPSTKMLRHFLSYKPEVNIQDARGSTPLDLAIRYHIEKLAKVLMAAGGRTNVEKLPEEWLS
jgi:ankyrin repeat protein